MNNFLSNYNCNFFSLEHKQPLNSSKKHLLVPNSFYNNNELTNINKIKKYELFYYIPTNKRKININEMDQEFKHNYIKTDNSSIIIEYQHKELSTFHEGLSKQTNKPKIYILFIINTYKHLLNSLYLLVQHQLIHNHINFQNVLIDKYNTALLTNFSLSIDISHSNFKEYIKHFIISYDPEYIEWPLEFHLLAYLQTNKLKSPSKYNIETVVNNVIDNHYILATFGTNFINSYRTEAIEYYSKYINKTFDYILTDCLHYYNTWDNYTLSILFLRILIEIYKSIHTNNKFIILFMKLLVINIHSVPLKRMSIEDTIIQFDGLISTIKPNEYNDLITAMT